MIIQGGMGIRFGPVFIALMMFLPYGIVGTWHLKKAGMMEGWARLARLVRDQQVRRHGNKTCT